MQPTPRRFRFGLRSLFVVTAVVAVSIAAWELGQRRAGFLRQAWTHSHDQHFVPHVGLGNRTLKEVEAKREVRSEFHRRMSEKYAHAASYPWLPVEPDPSEPPLD